MDHLFVEDICISQLESPAKGQAKVLYESILKERSAISSQPEAFKLPPLCAFSQTKAKGIQQLQPQKKVHYKLDPALKTRFYNNVQKNVYSMIEDIAKKNERRIKSERAAKSSRFSPAPIDFESSSQDLNQKKNTLKLNHTRKLLPPLPTQPCRLKPKPLPKKEFPVIQEQRGMSSQTLTKTEPQPKAVQTMLEYKEKMRLAAMAWREENERKPVVTVIEPPKVCNIAWEVLLHMDLRSEEIEAIRFYEEREVKVCEVKKLMERRSKILDNRIQLELSNQRALNRMLQKKNKDEFYWRNEIRLLEKKIEIVHQRFTWLYFIINPFVMLQEIEENCLRNCEYLEENDLCQSALEDFRMLEMRQRLQRFAEKQAALERKREERSEQRRQKRREIALAPLKKHDWRT
ncbi:hypothetical protein DNTS_007775 [Danionella cerebrum]|uniref:Uncharacterized protein n=1 Tax=Danionella cerebrum TaxID=2873325 RepID=A0A553NMG4_9TELE|nr:hypothetical protein DNTS_007775 [Danionella translucida]